MAGCVEPTPAELPGEGPSESPGSSGPGNPVLPSDPFTLRVPIPQDLREPGAVLVVSRLHESRLAQESVTAVAHHLQQPLHLALRGRRQRLEAHTVLSRHEDAVRYQRMEVWFTCNVEPKNWSQVLAYVTASQGVRSLLQPLGLPTQPGRLAPARGPPQSGGPAGRQVMRPGPGVPGAAGARSLARGAPPAERARPRVSPGPPYAPTPGLDAHGRTVSAIRTVQVDDRTPPTLQLLGSSSMTHTCGSQWVDPGVTALDACYGNVAPTVRKVGEVNGWVPGVYTVRYELTDSGGNVAQSVQRTVQVANCPW